MVKRHKSEPPEISCETLLQFLENPAFSIIKDLLYRDFLTKATSLDPSTSAEMHRRGLRIFGPSSFSEIMTADKPTTLPRKKVDIGLVTVIGKELQAAKIALGIDLDAECNVRHNGIRFWETTIKNATRNEIYSVVLWMIGEAHNVKCAAAMSTFLQRYDVKACILVGVAAGLKAKTKLGDVVVSENFVLDYEANRLESTGPIKQPTPYTVPAEIRRDLQHFDPGLCKWREFYTKCRERIPTAFLDKEFAGDVALNYVPGIILSGATFLADGSLPIMRQEYHEKVRAAEQEASGFAAFCQENRLPWLIFRGICDYGDADSTVEKAWQTIAALSAATCAIKFIEREFRLSDEF